MTGTVLVWPQNAVLETLVATAVERVLNGGKTEDSRMELKSAWPTDPQRAARQLAGFINAANSPWVTWIVGVDEEGHRLTGPRPEELANWWPRVASRFEGLAPDAAQNLTIPVGSGAVMALFFETSRRPFVIKLSNLPADSEVPWREGNQTRSARRLDLLKMLVPKINAPEGEILGATLTGDFVGGEFRGNISGAMYLDVPVGGSIVFPFHRCEVAVRIGEQRISPTNFRFSTIQHGAVFQRGAANLPTAAATDSEVIFPCSGRVAFAAGCTGRADHHDCATIAIRLQAYGVEPVTVEQTLTFVQGSVGRPLWK